MSLHHAFHDGKTEPASPVLRREEGIEDLVPNLLPDARPRVGDPHLAEPVARATETRTAPFWPAACAPFIAEVEEHAPEKLHVAP